MGTQVERKALNTDKISTYNKTIFQDHQGGRI